MTPEEIDGFVLDETSPPDTDLSQVREGKIYGPYPECTTTCPPYCAGHKRSSVEEYATELPPPEPLNAVNLATVDSSSELNAHVGATKPGEQTIPIWDEPGYVSVAFFAAFTAQGVSTVRKKFASGKLKGKNFDGSIRILKSELRPDR